MDLDIRHEEGKRYYIQFGDQGGEGAELTYRETDKTRDFRHTYVPEELRGQRIAERLVRHALDDTIKSGYKIIPTCPYVKHIAEKYPEYQAGLAQSAGATKEGW